METGGAARDVSVWLAYAQSHAPCCACCACRPLQVPAALQEALRHTLEAVAAPEARPGSLSTADASAVWGCLADCMRDSSELGSRAGRGWLLQLLVAAAEHEVARISASSPAEQQREQGHEEAPPALLPEVAAHGGCQLQPGRRGLLGQDSLRELLLRALATTPDHRAADCLMAAVSSLLAHVRLRCASAGWEQDDAWGPGAGAGSSSAGSIPKMGSASRLSASHASLAEAEAGGLPQEGSEDDSIGAHSSPFEGHTGGWRVSRQRQGQSSRSQCGWPGKGEGPLPGRPPCCCQPALLHAANCSFARFRPLPSCLPACLVLPACSPSTARKWCCQRSLWLWSGCCRRRRRLAREPCCVPPSCCWPSLSYPSRSPPAAAAATAAAASRQACQRVGLQRQQRPQQQALMSRPGRQLRRH